MSVYRYSPERIQQVVRRISARTQAITLTAVALGFTIASVNTGFNPWLLMVVLPFAGFLLVVQARKIRSLVEHTEFEIDEDVLIGRNPSITTTIRREEVSEFRYLDNGIAVRGKGITEVVEVLPELQGYEELAARLEAWVPAGVERKRAAGSASPWVVPAILLNLALLFVAFTSTAPAIAIPVCLAEAAVLIGCMVLVLRNPSWSPKMRRAMLGTLIPALSLLGRAYMIWSGAGI